MKHCTSKRLTVELEDGQQVSGLLQCPAEARACLVFAHGAGAGMEHAFMSAVAEGLAERQVGTLRYQFPFMEKGSKRTDPPAVAQATVRAAVAKAVSLLPGVPIFAGGKSFGARMSSQAQAALPMPHVRGLVFIGFPLHPAGKPASGRALHLFELRIPMLFLQGTRDALADMGLLLPIVGQLGAHVTMRLFDHADHAFHVPARSGNTDAQVLAGLLDAIAGWTAERTART